MAAVVPAGFHTLTPTLVLNNAAAAIELYIKIFAAEEEYRMIFPGSSRIAHACLRFGDSKLFLRDVLDIGDEATCYSRFYLYADDVMAVCKLAVSYGFEQILMPPEDMFWGDRLGMVRDPFGIAWIIATHEREVSPDEMEIGRKEFMRSIAG